MFLRTLREAQKPPDEILHNGGVQAVDDVLSATREVVARVTSDAELDEHDRATAEKLIRLNVPALDRVEFVVSP